MHRSAITVIKHDVYCSSTLITNLVKFMPVLLTSDGLQDTAMWSMDHFVMELLLYSLTAQQCTPPHVSRTHTDCHKSGSEYYDIQRVQSMQKFCFNLTILVVCLVMHNVILFSILLQS